MKNKNILKRLLPPFIMSVLMGLIFGGMSALLPMIREDFSLTHSQIGLYTTSIFIASFAASIFGGYLIDILGVYKGLAIGGGIMGTFVALYSVSYHYGLILFFAFFAGTGQSLIAPAANKAATLETKGRGSGGLMGLILSGNSIGALIGAALLPLIAVSYGWRSGSLFGGSLFIVAAIIVFFLKSTSAQDRSNEKIVPTKQENKVSLISQLRSLLAVSETRLYFLMGLSFAAIMSSLFTYLPIWLKEEIGLSITQAGISLSLLQFGGIFGKPFWGFLADRKKSQKETLLFLLIQSFSVLIIGLVFAFAKAEFNLYLLMLLCFLMGFSGLGFVGVFIGNVAIMVNPSSLGVATGLSFAFIRLGIVIFPPLFGLIADLTDSFTFSWLLMSLLPFIAVLLNFLSLKRKK